MRTIAVMILLTGLTVPNLAQAKSVGDQTYTKSVEQGVTVYRGRPSQENAAYVSRLHHQYVQREKTADLKRKVYKQQRQIAAQKASIKVLETRLTRLEAHKKKRAKRSRYGKSYYGNPPFFGRNGFAGNANFRGAGPIQTNVRPRYRRGRGY